ncbi:1-phosphofructokinase [Pseudoramibacter faecis]|uniref:1-phosphofructokinase n=1 Tax=Pseudoramibacter faecis TaxID=3108534 RepID=UPI002E77D5F4|nr:1-phosphofructokinase [Pseudoramibacter sp. HA2172]
MITTVTLNASIDKAYHMDSAIVGGTVMRVARCQNSAGGKGLNVARVVKRCGEAVQATGLVGGFNGQYLESLLDLDGITHDFGRVAGETRSCINILDPKFSSTELLEPGCTVSEEAFNCYLKKFKTIIDHSQIITLSGSAPAGMPKDIYARFIKIIKDAGKTAFLDASGELLKQGIAGQAKPDFVKPNRDEIQALFNVTLRSFDDVVFYAKKIYEMGIAYVVVSLGGDGSLLVCSDGVYQAVPPKIDVVNTVGCGDSMVAGFAVALKNKWAPQEALRYASAVASANALSPNTGDFKPEEQKQMIKNTMVKVL